MNTLTFPSKEQFQEQLSNYQKNHESQFMVTNYWDYNQELSKEQIIRILNGNGDEVCNEISDWNLDYFYGLRTQKAKEIIEDVIEDVDELKEENEFLYDEFVDITRDMVEVDENYQQLFNNSNNSDNSKLTYSLYSNYDCMNSWFFESQGTFGYETYIGDILKVLRINPKEFALFLESEGYDVFVDQFPNIENLEPIVEIPDLYHELLNNSCPASLLTFIVKIDDLWEYYINSINDNNKNTKINTNDVLYCGIFSSINGGGSIMDLKLKPNKIIETIENDEYSSIELNMNGYSYDEVYG